jgi:transketolase
MAAAIRRWVIEQSLESKVGHIGSALSVVDVVAVLWSGVMRGPGTADPDRDRFVLSKGHAALALYGALRFNGLLDEKTFRTYCGDGTALGCHPEHALPGIDVSTGSLGQGLSVGCGLAYGLRRQGRLARVYVLISDAECNEGQVWEAAMFAAHHRLGNLTAVVDLNRLQALGDTRGILDLTPMAARWQAFGWEVFDVDGHDPEALHQALTMRSPSPRPRLVVAHTHLGQGVPFMRDRVEWHYRNLTPELAGQALAALEAHA